MVSQCANPECGAQFLYFGRGQLITVRHHQHSAAGSDVEFFWLCGDCVTRWSLEVGLNGSMNLVPRHFQSSSARGPLKEVGYELR